MSQISNSPNHGPETQSAEPAVSTINGASIDWDDSEMESIYANIGTATANREEFFLLFGTHQHWRGSVKDNSNVKVKLANRVVMSPFAAKRLAGILAQSIKAYESKYGSIDV